MFILKLGSSVSWIVDIAVGDHFQGLFSDQTNSVLVGPILSSSCAVSASKFW